MDCREIQRCMSRFLNGELEAAAQKEFVVHVRSCKECMEELTIEYLLSEGIQDLESTETIDVQKILEAKLRQTPQNGRVRSQLQTGLFVVAAMLACVLLIIV